MQTTNTTEQQIIEAARKIFMHRGLTGARMQDIADEAGINKAMLHYYYRSKDKLFDIVLTEAVDQMLSRLNAVFSGDLGLEEKIRSAVDNYISGISENPYLPLFVLNEINQNPGRIATRFLSAPNFPNILGFAQQLMEGMEKGTLRKVDPVQLMISIISMCIFPFVARPLLQAVFTVDDPGFRRFMEDRKVFVTEFVLSALRP